MDSNKYSDFQSTSRKTTIEFIPQTQENGNNIYTILQSDNNTKQQNILKKEPENKTVYANTNIPFTSQLYYGSLTVLGLYIVFRIIQNTKH